MVGNSDQCGGEIVNGCQTRKNKFSATEFQKQNAGEYGANESNKRLGAARKGKGGTGDVQIFRYRDNIQAGIIIDKTNIDGQLQKNYRGNHPVVILPDKPSHRYPAGEIPPGQSKKWHRKSIHLALPMGRLDSCRVS